MMNHGSSYNYLSWLHYVAGPCGPSCPYCPNFSPDAPYTTLSCEHVVRFSQVKCTNHLAPSIAPPVANHANFNQAQSTFVRPESATDTPSIGIGHDDRAGLAETGSAYAYTTSPSSFRAYQSSDEVYQPMDAHYQRVQDTSKYVLRIYSLHYPD